MPIPTNLFAATIQISISVLVNALIAMSAASVALFFTRRPGFALIQRWIMGTVLASLAIKMAVEARR